MSSSDNVSMYVPSAVDIGNFLNDIERIFWLPHIGTGNEGAPKKTSLKKVINDGIGC